MGLFNFTYPWDQWLNGEEWVLDPVMDVNKNYTSFRTGLKRQLMKRQLNGAVRKVTIDGKPKIKLQSWTDLDDRPAWIQRKDIVRW